MQYVKVPNFTQGFPTIMSIIFEVKRGVIVSNKHGTYELPLKLLND